MTYRKPDLFHFPSIACMLLLGLAFVPSDALAQGGGFLVSDAIIHRVGLKVEWASQAPVGASNQLVDWELQIDENQATTTVEVRSGNRREVFSQYDRNPLGELLGVAGAEQLAQDRKEHMLAEFAARGKKDAEVTIESFQQPKATLFMMSDSGDVTSLDANTGKTLWLNRVGNGSGRGIGLGANADFVAVVRGSSVYCLDASTGKELWTSKCRYAVGASPAVTDLYIMVPLLDGRLETFSLEGQGVGANVLMAFGEGTAQPLVTERSVSWPTSRGELNVMARNGAARTVNYRLRSDDAIVSEATSDGENLFIGSLDGFLYAIDEALGSVNWAISLGFGISQSAIPLGEFVYAISGEGKLYKVLGATGEPAPGWETPLAKVSRYLGASKKNLYLLDSQGAMVVVDRGSRTIVSSAPVGQVDLILNNYKSDRIYLASKSGIVQCLREVTSERPHFHDDEIIEKTMEGSASKNGSGSKDGSGSKNGSGSKDGSGTKPGSNPFADTGSSDPFGGSDTKNNGSDTKDPFGGSDTKDQGSDTKGEDPFGGSGTKDDGSSTKGEDPFGGSSTKDDGSGTKGEGSDTKDPFGDSSEDPFGGAGDAEDPFG